MPAFEKAWSGFSMSIEKIMSKNIISVGMDATLADMKRLFDSKKFHHLLVIESNKLMGMISDRDLLKALSPNIGKVSESTKDAATLNKRAHQIMSRKLVTIAPDASINDAIGIFIKQNISCIPVVDADNYPVGVLSWRDILKMVYVDS